ncbi:hypothetical protein DXD09_01090 [Ligilactobacillus ruminis]|uniref:Uncharacterized protein n=1 Tax=Ligilactobacillus ruminis TaxID=1623 RepID=A0A8B2Z3C1_9LACO|nr:hypothetical protein DXD09_01090 [Ligilactobacillus ruminis]
MKYCFLKKIFSLEGAGRIIAVGIFVKCSAPHRLFEQCTKIKMGFRAKRRFLGFARKKQPPVTVEMPFPGLCP